MAAIATAPGTFRFAANLTWVQKELGWLIDEVESFPTISNSGVGSLIVPQNGDRVGMTFVNGTSNTIVVALNSFPSTLFGIPIAPNGGAISFKIRDDFTLIARAWYGFSTPGNGSLYVSELIGRVPLPPGTAPGY